MAADPSPSPDRSGTLTGPLTTAFTAVAAGFLLLHGATFRTTLTDPDGALLGLLLLFALALPACLRLARRPRLLAPAGALAAMAVWSAVAALDAVYPRAAAEAVAWQLLFTGVAWCGLLVAFPPRRDRVIDGLLWAAAGVATVGVAQALGWASPGGGHLTEFGQLRIESTLNHPNNLAGFVALLLPLALARGVRLWRGGQRGAGAAALVLALALLWLAGETYSKGGQLAVLVALLAWVALAVGPRWRAAWGGQRRRALAWAAVGAVLLLAAGVLFWQSGLGSRLRLFVDLLPTLPRFHRWMTWAAAARMALAEPLTGVGPGCFFLAFPSYKLFGDHAELKTHAHNWFLHVAAEGGLPLLVALLVALAAALVAARRGAAAGRAGRLESAGLFAAILGFAVAGVFDYNVGVPALGACFWFVLGLAAGQGDWAGDSASRRALHVALAGALALGLLAAAVPLLLWNRAKVDYLVALGHVQQGDLAAAAERLEAARSMDPANVAYDLVRADLARWMGDAAAARRWLEQVAGDHPLPSSYRDDLAWLLAQTRELDAARQTLETAIAADPAEPVLRVDAGLLALLAGESEPAAARFEEALSADADAAGAWAGRGALAWAAGDSAQGAAAFGAGAALHHPRDRVPRFLIGYGALDPAEFLPADHRARRLSDRLRFHGGALPRLHLRLLAARAQAEQGLQEAQGR